MARYRTILDTFDTGRMESLATADSVEIAAESRTGAYSRGAWIEGGREVAAKPEPYTEFTLKEGTRTVGSIRVYPVKGASK